MEHSKQGNERRQDDDRNHDKRTAENGTIQFSLAR